MKQKHGIILIYSLLLVALPVLLSSITPVSIPVLSNRKDCFCRISITNYEQGRIPALFLNNARDIAVRFKTGVWTGGNIYEHDFNNR